MRRGVGEASKRAEKGKREDAFLDLWDEAFGVGLDGM